MISSLTKKYTNRDYILYLFVQKHKKKKWPFYKDLISKIRREYKNTYSILMAPSQDEIEEAKKFNVNIVMDEGKAVGIKKLISLISDAKYIVSNDTGPAHIASHLNKKGIVLFGEHPQQSVIETQILKF